MTMIDDPRLDEVLASIGPLLVLEPATGSRRGTGARRRRWWARLGALVAALASRCSVSSPLRGAVADWLGIGSTQVEVRPDAVVPDSLPMIDDGATPISPAARRTGSVRTVRP